LTRATCLRARICTARRERGRSRAARRVGGRLTARARVGRRTGAGGCVRGRLRAAVGARSVALVAGGTRQTAAVGTRVCDHLGRADDALARAGERARAGDRAAEDREAEAVGSGQGGGWLTAHSRARCRYTPHRDGSVKARPAPVCSPRSWLAARTSRSWCCSICRTPCRRRPASSRRARPGMCSRSSTSSRCSGSHSRRSLQNRSTEKVGRCIA